MPWLLPPNVKSHIPFKQQRKLFEKLYQRVQRPVDTKLTATVTLDLPSGKQYRLTHWIDCRAWRLEYNVSYVDVVTVARWSLHDGLRTYAYACRRSLMAMSSVVLSYCAALSQQRRIQAHAAVH